MTTRSDFDVSLRRLGEISMSVAPTQRWPWWAVRALAGKCEKGPHRYERQGPFTRRSQDRSPATPPTGTGDAPGRSVGSSDPDGLVTWPPQPPVGKPPGHCLDLRLRPIPLLPEEEREGSSIAPEPGATRGSTTFLSHTSGSG